MIHAWNRSLLTHVEYTSYKQLNARFQGMEHTPIQSYRDLTAWKKSVELVVEVYSISRSLPSDERFALGAQIRRAAVSVSANIAEGHGSSHRGTYLRHLAIARGSLKETECLVELADRLGMLRSDDLIQARCYCDDTSRLLTALIRALSRSTALPFSKRRQHSSSE